MTEPQRKTFKWQARKPTPPRVTSKIRTRQSLGRARSFVEEFFGRGRASAKITFNLNTVNRATVNYLRATKKKQENFDFENAGAALIPLGSKGVKNILYLRKDQMDFPEFIIHEYAHAAYYRIRKRKGKRNVLLVSEILSYALHLEWLLTQNARRRFERWMDKGEGHYVDLEEGNFMRDGSLTSKVFTASKAGLALASGIFEKFPKESATRRLLLKDLMEKEFTTFKQAAAWIEKYRPIN